eukprot:m.221350 g.221350  ORF g.221350 m.221350 type:complete len:1158 (+) comp17247_c0_seq2:3-3476(+)
MQWQLDGRFRCADAIQGFERFQADLFVECMSNFNVTVRNGVLDTAQQFIGNTACAMISGVATDFNHFEAVTAVSTLSVEVLPNYVLIKGNYSSVRLSAIYLPCELRYVRLESSPPPGTTLPRVVEGTPDPVFVPACVDVSDQLRTTTIPRATPTIREDTSSEASSSIKAGAIAGISIGVAMFVLAILVYAFRRTRQSPDSAAKEDELLTLALEKSNASFAAKYGHANASLERLKLEFDLLQLQPSQLKLGKSLGQGRFGRRYRATFVTGKSSQHDEMTLLIGGSTAALLPDSVEKDRHCQVLALDHADLQLYEEFFVMCRLHHLVSRRHPHILHFMGQVLDQARPLCVLEWTQHGTLRHYLQHSRRHGRELTLDHCMTVFRQVSSAMAHLESLGIVHRQLCVENVFVGKDHNHVKVTGFSMARDVYHSSTYIGKQKAAWQDSTEDTQDETGEGDSLRYTAPEALDDQVFTLKSDVYAFAVFMWETFKNGEQVYAGLGKTDLARTVRTQRHLAAPTGTVCDEWSARLMRQASQVKASDRPSFESVFSRLWTKQASRFETPQVVLSADASSSQGEGSRNRFVLVSLGDELFRTVTAVAQHGVVKGSSGSQDGVVHYNPNAPSSALSKGWTAISHVLMRFQHPNVQSCLGVVQVLGPQHPLTGLVFAEEEPLLDYVLRVNVPETELCRLLCVDVLAGLQHLSARAVACKQVLLDNLVVVQQRIQLRCLDAMLIKEASECNLASFCTFIQGLPEALRAVERVPSYHQALKLMQASADNRAINGFQRIASLLLQFEDMFSDGTSSWELDWDDLLFVKELGTGNFGQVNLMSMTTHKQSHNRFGRSSGSARGEVVQELVAVKTLTDSELESDFLQEINMMKQLSHPNLVALLHVITQSSERALVLEYLELGALQEWLQSRDGFMAPLQDLAFIAHQVACGMSELANLGIVHRDLAARNVLLGRNLVAKVADFGLSRNVGMSHNAQQMYYRFQTNQPLAVRWVAPEMIPTQRASTTTDVYSYGMLLYEIFTRGKIPFEEKEDKEVLQHLRVLCKQEPRDVPSMQIEDRLPQGVKGLMIACISLSVEARPTFGKLVLETLPHCWKPLLHLPDSVPSSPTHQTFVRPGEQVQSSQPVVQTASSSAQQLGGYTVLTEGQGVHEESHL